MKKMKLVTVLCIMAITLFGCGTDKEESIAESKPGQNLTESAASSETTPAEVIDLNGINPDAAGEIRHILDAIDAALSLDDQTGTEKVIQSTLPLMGMAVGNSLVEEQVTLVVKDWKSRKTADELNDFIAKYQIAYEEYQMLNSDQAANELAKAGLSLTDYDYCGGGQLDMVEWIKELLN